jgi:hypothetical protein
MLLVCFVHSFLKLSKIEISENLKFLARMFPRGRLLLAVGVIRAAFSVVPSNRNQTTE